MPELPEVETIRRVLEPQLLGQQIAKVIVNHPQVIAYPDPHTFSERLIGQTFTGSARRGKFLSFLTDGGLKLTLHLRMTGGLLLTPADFPARKHTHLIIRLNDGRELRFADPRRFGRFWLLDKGEEDIYSGASKLGLEPFDDGLHAGYLRGRLGKSRKAIKECLLDQTVVCGIGNIYSDEILYAAKILPDRSASTLSDAEWERLAREIPRLLTYFIGKNAISPEEYLQTGGDDYRNTPFLRVYGHEKEPCPECGRALKKKVIGGRSSVYCISCQR